MADKIKSKRAQRALDQMGDNLKTARLKRRMAVKDFAGRVGVSTRTITRLEKGDDGVSIG
ncbi:MAG: helix-turn-helix transcriptional regulator, partial [Gammaproteobacteria bacterium]|nr:helix-turn-helix transcriptional regulator [Gammaproteobacteria bacterium]